VELRASVMVEPDADPLEQREVRQEAGQRVDPVGGERLAGAIRMTDLDIPWRDARDGGPQTSRDLAVPDPLVDFRPVPSLDARRESSTPAYARHPVLAPPACQCWLHRRVLPADHHLVVTVR